MTVNVDGFDDIFSIVEQLGDVGKKAGKKAVKSGLEEVLDQLKEDAPEDKQKSKNELSIQHIRTNKNGSVWGACGIGKDNWDKAKQLWYQHYGYDNHGLNFTGQRVETNVGWMDKSFKKVEKKANNKMIEVLGTEIDKVLK